MAVQTLLPVWILELMELVWYTCFKSFQKVFKTFKTSLSMHVHLPLNLCGHMEGAVHLAVGWLATCHHCTGPFRRCSSTLRLDTAHKSPFDWSIICYWLCGLQHEYTLTIQDDTVSLLGSCCVVALDIARMRFKISGHPSAHKCDNQWSSQFCDWICLSEMTTV